MTDLLPTDIDEGDPDHIPHHDLVHAVVLDVLPRIAGGELGYAEITSTLTTTSTSSTDAAGLSISIETGVRPIELKFGANNVSNNTSGKGIVVEITDDADTVICRVPFSPVATNSQQIPGFRSRRISPGPGTHVYKVRFWAVSGGTATIGAAADDPAYIQAVEVGAADEIGYAEKTSSSTTTSTTSTDAGLSVTAFVNGDRTVMVRFGANNVSNTVSGDGTVVEITDASNTVICRAPFNPSASAGQQVPVLRERRLTGVSRGEHTWKVRFYAITGGTATIGAAADDPMYLQVIEV